MAPTKKTTHICGGKYGCGEEKPVSAFVSNGRGGPQSPCIECRRNKPSWRSAKAAATRRAQANNPDKYTAEYFLASTKTTAARRIAKGTCPGCGRRPKLAERQLCGDCLQVRRTSMSKRRQAAAASGLCNSCLQRPKAAARSCCTVCLAKIVANSIARDASKQDDADPGYNPQLLVVALVERDGSYACQSPLECGSTCDPTSADYRQHPTVGHIVPRSRWVEVTTRPLAEAHDLSNLRLECRSCNSRKGNKLDSELPTNAAV